MSGTLKYGPKPRSLTPNETLNSLEVWKCNILYGLRVNEAFRPFLVDGFVWGRKSKTTPYRSLKDDVVQHAAVEGTNGSIVTPAREEIVKTREDKAYDVDLMLDQIANYAECIPRNDIVKDSESLEVVWQKIRLFYNLQSSGSLLNECWNIRRLPDETPQALYARLKQTYDENLIHKNSLFHVYGKLSEDEEMSPTLHNTIVLHWLEILHPKLRSLVTQKFAIELRDATYATIFPEISRSIDSLLQELEDDSYQGASCRALSFNRRGGPSYPRGGSFRPDRKQSYPQSYDRKQSYSQSYEKRNCQYCKLMGKRAYGTHNIEDCLFIKRDAQANQKQARALDCEELPSEEDENLASQYAEFYEDCTSHKANRITDHVINKIVIDASPVLRVHHREEAVAVTLDSGATCNVIGKKEATKHQCQIRSTNQTARMADGKSSLDIIGETDMTFHRGKKSFHMTALVASNTDIDFLGGIPFMRQNDIAIRPATSEIILDGTDFVKYESSRGTGGSNVRRLTSHVSIQSARREVILPGDSFQLKLPSKLCSDDTVAVEPRLDSCHNRIASKSGIWPPAQIAKVSAETISLVNDTKVPVVIKKNEQICLVHNSTSQESVKESVPTPTSSLPTKSKPLPKTEFYSNAVNLNPDSVLTKEESQQFSDVMREYDEVFNPKIGHYNGKSGPCFVEVNIATQLPPQRKGQVPFYNHKNLQELQDKMDELKDKGVFARPQEVGVTVENVSPSFLVRKPHNPQQKRLVTNFASIAPYCRPTPSYMPKINKVLHKIAGWNYIIPCDMSEAYYQILLRKCSQRYCGVVTPFKGLLVYQTGVMGLPGVEVALEELTALILGDLVHLGAVAKVADDIFIGGRTVEELLSNFRLVLHRLLENNIRLSARKTTIAPREVTILGWIWRAGMILASPHYLSALGEVKPPLTVSAMRSFIGSYRFLSRVLKGYASLLAPLEKTIVGNRSGNEEIQWTDELLKAFQKAQEALKDSKALTIPTPDDQLWIVTDASVQPGAVGATLYTVRDGKPKLAEFFNAKLPAFQSRWLPCEVEGIAIGTALHHFAQYILESKHKPQVLTDSKPCVQAAQKMCKGQFSSSARLSTFLSAVSQHQAQVRHVSGEANLPSDFSSRNPVPCLSESCQVCTFIKEYAESPVLALSVSDLEQGRVQIPYKNRKAWLEVQRECPDLRKVLSFKKAGTEPSKKAKNLKVVKRYMDEKLILANDGLLVERKADPLSPMKDHIVVPQQVLFGLLSALHLTFEHPTAFQLAKLFNREFFALNVGDAAAKVYSQCHVCQSIKDIPKALIKQSSCEPPAGVGVSLAADVMIRSKQKILVLRETTTSYTLAEVIPNETKEVIANSLLRMCSVMRPAAVQEMVIRVDPGPANRGLFINVSSLLEKKNIRVEVGRELNRNKNPVVDKAIKELSRELLILLPVSGVISPTTLALAVANLNSRVRAPGLSAHELWTQRDQFSGEQLPVDDEGFIRAQQERRLLNHSSSERSKAPGRTTHPSPSIEVGSLVYIYDDRSKEHPRQRYLVISISNGWCKLRRFAKKYFGGRTYDAKLEECFAVPVESFSEPVVNEESDTDESGEWYEVEDEDHQPSITENVISSEITQPMIEEHKKPQLLEEPIPVLVTEQDPPVPRQLVEPAPMKVKRQRKKKTVNPVLPHNNRPRRSCRLPEKFKDYYIPSDDSEVFESD